MTAPPIERLARWVAARRDRAEARQLPPTVDRDCAAFGCGHVVRPGAAYSYDSGTGNVSCSEYCHYQMMGESY
jgi:hypothetical protein